MDLNQIDIITYIEVVEINHTDNSNNNNHMIIINYMIIDNMIHIHHHNHHNMIEEITIGEINKVIMIEVHIGHHTVEIIINHINNAQIIITIIIIIIIISNNDHNHNHITRHNIMKIPQIHLPYPNVIIPIAVILYLVP